MCSFSARRFQSFFNFLIFLFSDSFCSFLSYKSHCILICMQHLEFFKKSVFQFIMNVSLDFYKDTIHSFSFSSGSVLVKPSQLWSEAVLSFVIFYIQWLLQFCWAFCLPSDSCITWKEKDYTAQTQKVFRAVNTFCEHISTAFRMKAVLGELSVLVLLYGALRDREKLV